MCGIAGLLLSPKDLEHVSVDDMIRTLGLEIESRGKDATGVARLTASNRLRVEKTPQRATEFFSKHPGIGQGCRLALVHTRAATKGLTSVIGNNHPITSGPITGIHNGIVSNDDALFAKHGWKRVAEVDSEAIFTAIHNLGWKEAMELLNGSIACAWHDMTKPGHLFVARHTSNPVNVGISASGSVVFASTNAAVAKAMAVLGSTEVKIDPIKEGAMLEFWIDDEGVLQTVVSEFEPPKVVWSRAGAYEYEQGAWFPADRSYGSGYTWKPQGTKAGSTSASTPRSTTALVRGFDIGREGYVIRVKDEVVFVPNDTKGGYQPIIGTITHFGGRVGWCFVEVELDWGMRDELALPVCQLLPIDVWHGSNRKPEHPPLALPPVKVESEVFDGRDDKSLDDFLMPKTLQELVDAIEEIFGAEALDLLPIAWEDPDSEVYDVDNESDVIDVEEVKD